MSSTPSSTVPPTSTKTPCSSSIAADLAQEFKRFHGVEFTMVEDPTTLASIPLAVIPEGKQLASLKPYLDQYRDAPERTRGTATIETLSSLIEHTNRFKVATSALFAHRSPTAPSITAVLDYADVDAPAFGTHRAVYKPELSEEWQAWAKVNTRGLDQAAFAEFLEDRITDVVLADADDASLTTLAEQIGGRFAGPAGLMTLARGLQVNVSSVVRQAVSLATGEIAVQYEEQHKDGAGAPITTPNLFCIAIPVFMDGAPYRLPVRLRYRVQLGKITWAFHLYRPDRAFDHAFREACETAREATALPLFFGAPEA